MDKTLNLHGFELIDGKGLTSTVFQVVRRCDNTRYALKVMQKDKIERLKMSSRVRDEINILKSVQHPHIVQHHESFEDTTNIYIIVEFVQCGSLDNELKRLGRFSCRQTAKYIAQISDALSYLHDREFPIIHRDIKPENILLDDLGNVKLTDFGCSRQTSSKHELRKTFLGTPQYMAPEVIRGHPYNTAVDVWSVGVLLLEFLSGCAPFQGSSARRICENIINRQIASSVIGIPPLAADLARSLLKSTYGDRPKAKEIRKHPFIASNLENTLFKTPIFNFEESETFVQKNENSDKSSTQLALNDNKLIKNNLIEMELLRQQNESLKEKLRQLELKSDYELSHEIDISSSNVTQYEYNTLDQNGDDLNDSNFYKTKKIENLYGDINADNDEKIHIFKGRGNKRDNGAMLISANFGSSTCSDAKLPSQTNFRISNQEICDDPFVFSPQRDNQNSNISLQNSPSFINLSSEELDNFNIQKTLTDHCIDEYQSPNQPHNFENSLPREICYEADDQYHHFNNLLSIESEQEPHLKENLKSNRNLMYLASLQIAIKNSHFKQMFDNNAPIRNTDTQPYNSMEAMAISKDTTGTSSLNDNLHPVNINEDVGMLECTRLIRHEAQRQPITETKLEKNLTNQAQSSITVVDNKQNSISGKVRNRFRRIKTFFSNKVLHRRESPRGRQIRSNRRTFGLVDDRFRPIEKTASSTNEEFSNEQAKIQHQNILSSDMEFSVHDEHTSNSPNLLSQNAEVDKDTARHEVEPIEALKSDISFGSDSSNDDFQERTSLPQRMIKRVRWFFGGKTNKEATDEIESKLLIQNCDSGERQIKRQKRRFLRSKEKNENRILFNGKSSVQIKANLVITPSSNADCENALNWIQNQMEQSSDSKPIRMTMTSKTSLTDGFLNRSSDNNCLTMSRESSPPIKNNHFVNQHHSEHTGKLLDPQPYLPKNISQLSANEKNNTVNMYFEHCIEDFNVIKTGAHAYKSSTNFANNLMPSADFFKESTKGTTPNNIHSSLKSDSVTHEGNANKTLQPTLSTGFSTEYHHNIRNKETLDVSNKININTYPQNVFTITPNSTCFNEYDPNDDIDISETALDKDNMSFTRLARSLRMQAHKNKIVELEAARKQAQLISFLLATTERGYLGVIGTPNAPRVKVFSNIKKNQDSFDNSSLQPNSILPKSSKLKRGSCLDRE